MSRRVCIPSGYRYTFMGKRKWRGSSSEKWDIRVGKMTCGTLVGERRIDDAPVIVISTGRGAAKRYYAAGVHQVESRTRGKLRAPRGGK